MRKWTLALSLTTFAACHPASPPRDVSGPFTGTVHRYRIDAMTLPTSREQSADDLDGSGRTSDALFLLAGAVMGQGVQTAHASEMLAANATGGIVELQSDDPMLQQDESVGVHFFGVPVRDGLDDQNGLMGGVLRDGAITTNRLRYTHTPVPSLLRIPLFDADPILLPLVATQAQLTPDGHGGWNMELQGAAADAHGEVAARLATALVQGWALRPAEFGSLLGLIDHDRDGQITVDEIVTNGAVDAVTGPDLQLFDGAGHWSPNPGQHNRDSFSVAVHLHLVPCTDDACSAPAAAPSCFDRVRDGDELGVDCGGSCGRCPAGTACTADSDCLSRCVDQVCAAPSCSDGVNDGVEGGVDCGWGCAMACPNGDGCVDDAGCLSGSCQGGKCGAPQAQ